MNEKKSYRDPETIKRILERTKTIAVVGASSQAEKAGYFVPAYMQEHGYRIIPVNPNISQVLGEKSYPDMASVPEPVDLVLLFRRSEAVPPFVEAAIQAGAPAVWMQSGIIHTGAAEAARQAGLDVVMDACIMIEHRRWRRRKQ